MNPYHEKYLGIKSIDKKSPVFLCPLFAYVVVKKIINLMYDSLFDEFEYKFGREYARLLCNIQKNNGILGYRAIKAALEEYENFGFGRTKIVIMNKNKIILKNDFSSIARQYKKSFGDDRKNIDYFLSGVYSGILSCHLNKEVHVRESSCLVAGDPTCIFENTSIFPDSYAELTKAIAETIKWHRIQDEKFVNYPTPLIKNAFEQRHFKKRDGIIKLWNIYSVYFKFGFFVFSNYILTRIYSNISDLYRYVGLVQADIAVQFQKNQYGVEEKRRLYSSLLDQLDLFGYGHGSIKRLDKKRLHLRFKNINSLKQCLKFMKNFEDPYLEASLIGISRVFNSHISRFEMSPVKDDELVVSIEFDGKDDLSKKILKKINSKKIIEIVNEKMKHKYYLSPE